MAQAGWVRTAWCWAGALQGDVSALCGEFQLEEAAKPTEHVGWGRGSWAASERASSGPGVVQSPLKAVTTDMSHGWATQCSLWHLQAWDAVPRRGLPPLASQPRGLWRFSAGCSVAWGRCFLRAPCLAARSCWMGSYWANPASTGVAQCYRDEGNNQHSLEIKLGSEISDSNQDNFTVACQILHVLIMMSRFLLRKGPDMNLQMNLPVGHR